LALIINSIGKSRGINDESTLVILYKMWNKIFILQCHIFYMLKRHIFMTSYNVHVTISYFLRVTMSYNLDLHIKMSYNLHTHVKQCHIFIMPYILHVIRCDVHGQKVICIIFYMLQVLHSTCYIS
jgi:hypothetical protein